MEFKMSNFFCFKKRVDPKVTQIKLWDKAPTLAGAHGKASSGRGASCSAHQSVSSASGKS